MTIKFDSNNSNALVSAGLTPQQAEMYQLLLQLGSTRAGRIPRFLSISRPQAYKLLDELVTLGLASKVELPGKPTQYEPAHPFALDSLIKKQRENIELTSKRVGDAMASLITTYTSSSSQPGIRVLSGLEGLQQLYKDILAESSDLLVFRSVRDDDSLETRDLIAKQIEKQVTKGITARSIGPLPTYLPLGELERQDITRLVTRKVMDTEKFSLPAQIIIYGSSVGITDFQQPIITTIIENEAISATMRTFFEVIWQIAEEPRAYAERRKQ